MAKYPDVTAGQTEACINRMGGLDNFIRFIGGEGQIVWPTASVDEIVEAVLGEFSAITIPLSLARFVARKKFVKDTSSTAAVKITYLGDNFTAWFLSGEGKTEHLLQAEGTLRYARLRKSSVDAPIIAQLGGEVKAETLLAEFYVLLEAQKDGREGTLLTNGYANIFYIRDKNDVLRAVSAHWRADVGGWYVGADEVSNPDAWDGGYPVFSRNSSVFGVFDTAPAATA